MILKKHMGRKRDIVYTNESYDIGTSCVPIQVSLVSISSRVLAKLVNYAVPSGFVDMCVLALCMAGLGCPTLGL
jgi:hypothetical protein